MGVYSFFQQTKHVIQATVEIGQYDQELILSSDEIEFDINVLFNHSISQIGGKFLILKHTSDDKEESTRKINEIIDYIIDESNNKVERLRAKDNNRIIAISEQISSRNDEKDRLTKLELIGYDSYIELIVLALKDQELVEKISESSVENGLDFNNGGVGLDDAMRRLLRLPTNVELNISSLEIELSDLKTQLKQISNRMKSTDYYIPTSVVNDITSSIQTKRTLLKTIIGFIIGFFLSLMIVLIKHSLPKSIKSTT